MLGLLPECAHSENMYRSNLHTVSKQLTGFSCPGGREITVPDTCTTDSTGASHKIFFTEAADYTTGEKNSSNKQMNLKEYVVTTVVYGLENTNTHLPPLNTAVNTRAALNYFIKDSGKLLPHFDSIEYSQ